MTSPDRRPRLAESGADQRRPLVRLVAPLGLLVAIVMAGCGNGALAASPCQPCAAAVQQSQADAYATVAQRTYAVEVNGAANGFAYYVIRRLPGLVDGLATRNYALARAVVRSHVKGSAAAVRVTRGRRTLLDVGVRFVIAGRVHVIRSATGAKLGRVEVSTQDLATFAGLINRLTGAEVVVEGSTGQTKSSLAAAGAAVLPSRGPVVVGGREYTVSSFDERGFAGEPLHISILAPWPRAPRGSAPTTGGG